MTTGQRIAQKRKELGLSQEALGEKLGVSRQSIYKWESDAALPEIDKLVTLSRLFGLSVGVLLGVEEEDSGNKGELTEAQVKMVEDISRRYLDAIPQKTGRHLLWPLTALVLACFLVAAGMSMMTHRLNRMETQYHDLQSSIHSISGMVDSQMDAVTTQVEEMLKTHNELTDDYAAQVMTVVGTNGGGSSHTRWKENLAFALFLQQKLEKGFDALARPIVLRSAGFNQQLCVPGYLLVEVGGHGNTLADAIEGARFWADTAARALKNT